MKKTDVTQPVAMATPFAEGVYSATSTEDFEIPAVTSTTADDSCVMDNGFLPITSTALDDGGKAPERKNFNGMFYLSTDQRFFLQNGGFITYNPDVAAAIGGYPQDAILDFIDSNGTYKKVRSLIDDNSNNFVADETLIDGTNWEEIQMGGGSSRNIGEIVASTIPLTDAGLHLLDGSLIQGSGSYSAFVDYIADLYAENPSANYFTTEALWQQSVTTYGVCGKFVYNSVNNTVRLPKLGNQLIHNIPSTLGVKGNGMTLGLQGKIRASDTSLSNFGLSDGGSDLIARTVAYGTLVGTSHGAGDDPANNYGLGVTTDPTKSGIVAETNNINTADVYYYVVIATTTKTDIEVDIDEIATDLNGKADVDLSNVNDVGTSKAAGWAMPSDTYEDLTLGASGTTYTAPANGWIYINKGASSNQYLRVDTFVDTFVESEAIIIDYNVKADSNDTGLGLCFPVAKNQKYRISYNASGTTVMFRFIYAQGSESEAS